MPRPRSSTFYLPLAPVDAPLSLKAKLSVLPPKAANALLAPRSGPFELQNNAEDECARLERVLGCATRGKRERAASNASARQETPIFVVPNVIPIVETISVEMEVDSPATTDIVDTSDHVGIFFPSPEPLSH